MSVPLDSGSSRTLPTRPRAIVAGRGGTNHCGPAGVAPLLRTPPAGPCRLALVRAKTRSSLVTMRPRQITLNQHREASAATPSPPTPLPQGERGDNFFPLSPWGRGVGGEGCCERSARPAGAGVPRRGGVLFQDLLGR